MTIITKDFADTGALEAGWLKYSGGAADNYDRLSGQLRCTGATDYLTYWSSNTFAGDQEAQITVKTLATSDFSTGPAVKCVGGGSTSGYYIGYTATRLFIVRDTGGGSRSLVLDNTAVSISANAVIKMTAVAEGANLRLRAYINGVEVGSGYLDTAPLTGQYVGIGTWFSHTSFRGDDWSGGDFTGGSAGTPTGLATETDTALALAAKQIRPTGLAAETDTALALTSAAGFDFHTAAGLIFGDLSGALTSLARQAAVNMVLRVYAVASPGALVVESGTLTTDSNGRLARFTHASLVAGTAYHCVFIRNSDGEIVSTKLTAT